MGKQTPRTERHPGHNASDITSLGQENGHLPLRTFHPPPRTFGPPWIGGGKKLLLPEKEWEDIFTSLNQEAGPLPFIENDKWRGKYYNNYNNIIFKI